MKLLRIVHCYAGWTRSCIHPSLRKVGEQLLCPNLWKLGSLTYTYTGKSCAKPSIKRKNECKESNFQEMFSSFLGPTSPMVYLKPTQKNTKKVFEWNPKLFLNVCHFMNASPTTNFTDGKDDSLASKPWQLHHPENNCIQIRRFASTKLHPILWKTKI